MPREIGIMMLHGMGIVLGDLLLPLLLGLALWIFGGDGFWFPFLFCGGSEFLRKRALVHGIALMLAVPRGAGHIPPVLRECLAAVLAPCIVVAVVVLCFHSRMNDRLALTMFWYCLYLPLAAGGMGLIRFAAGLKQEWHADHPGDAPIPPEQPKCRQ